MDELDLSRNAAQRHADDHGHHVALVSTGDDCGWLCQTCDDDDFTSWVLDNFGQTVEHFHG